ncbi:MAG: hypothetical protein NPIRA03_06750 [Nitrospirales bacterium]|nr:MAG: hypothetical protein NPIRA03_06750 [Nitrospirales bacterium]
MLTDTLPTTQLCAYCGGNLKVGVAEDARLPPCNPSVRIGFICTSCGQLESPFSPREQGRNPCHENS